MNEKTEIQQAKLEKDIDYIKQSMSRNFKDHERIMKVLESGLNKKVSFSRYRVVEMIAFALAGSTLIWALNQILSLVGTVQAIF